MDALLLYNTSQILLSEAKLMLDKSMLDKNSFQPNFQSHPVNQTIQNIVELLKLQAQLKNVFIHFLKLSKDVLLKLDQLRLQQVIVILLQNALKLSKAND
jgi:signal transduction histidine kinase